MIKTGDWTIAELIKYLVAVQTTLTSTEFDRLKMTAAFPRERRQGEQLPENGKPPRQKACDLYEPIDVLRDLKLPVIDWGTHPKWRSGSEEGASTLTIWFIDLCLTLNDTNSQIPVQARPASLSSSPGTDRSMCK